LRHVEAKSDDSREVPYINVLMMEIYGDMVVFQLENPTSIGAMKHDNYPTPQAEHHFSVSAPWSHNVPRMG